MATFEENVKQLEAIVAQLERGNLMRQRDGSLQPEPFPPGDS